MNCLLIKALESTSGGPELQVVQQGVLLCAGGASVCPKEPGIYIGKEVKNHMYIALYLNGWHILSRTVALD